MRKKKENVKNYREKFRRYYGIEFGKEFDVHHIDLNHENNNIENLMLLPKELHHQYHMALGYLMPKNGFVRMGVKICGNNANMQTLELDAMDRFLKVMKECQKWRDYKFHLDLQKLYRYKR